MISTETILINGSQVAELITIEEAIDSIEKAFELYSTGTVAPPAILGVHATEGGFHIKAGILNLNRNYFVSKMNANFPVNSQKHSLPTIQGVVIVCDADNGRLLALMDSIELTIIRTGAATAVATKYLSRLNAKTITICGCGNQGKISLEAIMKVRMLEKVFVHDIEELKAKRFAKELSKKLQISIEPVKDIRKALLKSEICVTCTPSQEPFIEKSYISRGTFIAAVGADSEDKQELCSDLLASSKIVTDLTRQAATIGELHHGIKQGMISADMVYAELGDIVSGKKQGRETEGEIIVFDSTGMALQDVAAASVVYEKAITNNIGIKINFPKTKATTEY